MAGNAVGFSLAHQLIITGNDSHPVLTSNLKQACVGGLGSELEPLEEKRRSPVELERSEQVAWQNGVAGREVLFRYGVPILDLLEHSFCVISLRSWLTAAINQNRYRFDEQHWHILLVADSRNDVWMG